MESQILDTPKDQIEQFKSCVLKHITERLSPEEWVWLREQADDQVSGLMPPEPMDILASPQELVDRHIHEDSLRVKDILKVYTGSSIDEIAGQPVYYFPRTGIYLWGKSPEHGFSLSFWITHPAFPPGWQ